MNQHAGRHPIATTRVVYEAAGMDAVTVERDIVYEATDAGRLTMDVYRPGEPAAGPYAAVILVVGFPDAGAQAMLGCRFKEMGSFVSWAELVAASGMVAITCTTGTDPAADGRAVLRHVREHARALGIDPRRIGIWACSGHAPNALSLLMNAREGIRCAALLYPLTLDLDGMTGVADAARTFRFANPCAGRTVEELPKDVPIFIARAGQDATPGLGAALDRFLVHAARLGLSVTVAEHPTGPHAFDLFDDSDTSRDVVRQILTFLRSRLAA